MHKVQANFPSHRGTGTAVAGSLCAILVVTMVVGQLSSFETIPTLLEQFWPKTLGNGAIVLGALLVVVEVMSLPYLLGMYVSPLMRVCSLLCASIVASYLLFASTYSMGAGVAKNSGIFGTHLSMHGGVLLVVAVIFIALVGWYSMLAYADQNRA